MYFQKSLEDFIDKKEWRKLKESFLFFRINIYRFYLRSIHNFQFENILFSFLRISSTNSQLSLINQINISTLSNFSDSNSNSKKKKLLKKFKRSSSLSLFEFSPQRWSLQLLKDLSETNFPKNYRKEKKEKEKITRTGHDVSMYTLFPICFHHPSVFTIR